MVIIHLVLVAGKLILDLFTWKTFGTDDFAFSEALSFQYMAFSLNHFGEKSKAKEMGVAF